MTFEAEDFPAGMGTVTERLLWRQVANGSEDHARLLGSLHPEWQEEPTVEVPLSLFTAVIDALDQLARMPS